MTEKILFFFLKLIGEYATMNLPHLTIRFEEGVSCPKE